MQEVDAKLLIPLFDKAYWRSRQRFLFRKHAAFSKQRKHFEPEEFSAYADRFAKDLTLDDSREEIRRIYENCVTLKLAKRSSMDRGDTSLETGLFRFELEVSQDPRDHSSILIERRLHVKLPLNELPAHFDELFPWKATEIVIPYDSRADLQEMLEILEHWEEKLSGRLEESADRNELRLHLPSGFSMAVDLASRELVFGKQGIEGVGALAASVASDLNALGIRKELE
jgi:hypothetical protein